jgi:hypothetical protein
MDRRLYDREQANRTGIVGSFTSTALREIKYGADKSGDRAVVRSIGPVMPDALRKNRETLDLDQGVQNGSLYDPHQLRFSRV